VVTVNSRTEPVPGRVGSSPPRRTGDSAAAPSAGRPRRHWGWLLFVLPGLTLFVVFEVWPLLQAMLLSLFRWDGYSPSTFVGLDNYRSIAGDALFWAALRHAAVYAVGTVTAKIVLGLAIALLLHQQLAGRAFFRSVAFAPALMSFVAVGLLWQLIYSPQQGLLNSALTILHLPSDISWLGDPNLSLPSLMVVDIWKYTGYHAILFLAGLTIVQKDLLEAAEVDGASSVQQFWHVTLPGIRAILVVNIVIAAAGALNTFDLVYVMTNGGPYRSTEMPITYMYRMGFANGALGYASAVAFVMFVIVSAVTLAILKFQRSDSDAA